MAEQFKPASKLKRGSTEPLFTTPTMGNSERLIRNLFLSLLLLTSSVAWAHSIVECQIFASDEAITTKFFPEPSPLKSKSIDLSNGFRFAGIFNQEQSKFKAYVYYYSKKRFVLISKQEIQLGSNECGKTLGINETYSPYLENHLTYECTYLCNP